MTLLPISKFPILYIRYTDSVTKLDFVTIWSLPRGTEVPAYSDTGYSDSPLIVTLWTGPKSFITVTNTPLTVTSCLQ